MSLLARRTVAFFASPRLALPVLCFLALYIASAVWLRDTFLGGLLGEHPFGSPWFLTGSSLLFACTLGCTWLRTGKVLALRAGELPLLGVQVQANSAEELERLLAEHGFRGSGDLRWRHRFALWGGWLLHVALLLLMVGILIQIAFHDGGAFELVEGESVRLADPGVVFGREKGSFAPAQPPDLRVTLLSFDPYLHQAGYAPDRRSRLLVEAPASNAREVLLDRAEGVRIGSAVLYQAIPSGLALVIDIAGIGPRAIHLRSEGKQRATAEATDPRGRTWRFEVRSERELGDRRGTGTLTIEATAGMETHVLSRGDPFPFGLPDAKLLDVVRWSGHTYARSPGMPAVFCGFALVLAASAVLAFPAGIARIEANSAGRRARIWMNRGLDALRSDLDGIQHAATSPTAKDMAD